jgi:cardiolipin synthase
MNNQGDAQVRWTIPNLLTGFRFVAAPFLLWLAWYGYGIAFMALLAVSFFSDMLDGFIARLTHQVSVFGARLDSWADMVNYLTIAVSCWWLWPEMVLQELTSVVSIVVSIVLPPLIGLAKFGQQTSYHTWSVKLAAVSVGLSLYVMFLGGPAWPFRIAAVISVWAAVEEIAISLYLSEPKSNIRSFWDLRVLARRQRK